MAKSPSRPYGHEVKSPGGCGGGGYGGSPGAVYGGGSPGGGYGGSPYSQDESSLSYTQEESFNRSLQSALDKLGSVQYGAQDYGKKGGPREAGAREEARSPSVRGHPQYDAKRDETASPPRMSEREKTL